MTIAHQPLTFRGLLRAEWIAFVTLRRSWSWPSLVVVAVFGFAMLGAASPDTDVEFLSADGFVGILTGGLGVGQVLIAIGSALAMASDQTSGVVRAAFLADPGRVSSIVAKAFMQLLITTTATAIGVLTVCGPVVALIRSRGGEPPLSEPHVWTGIVAAVTTGVAASLLGTSLGLLIRNPAVAVIAVFALLVGVGSAIAIAAGASGQGWLRVAGSFAPGDALTVITAPPSGQEDGSRLPPWAASVVLVGWIGVLLTLGVLRIARREIP